MVGVVVAGAQIRGVGQLHGRRVEAGALVVHRYRDRVLDRRDGRDVGGLIRSVSGSFDGAAMAANFVVRRPPAAPGAAPASAGAAGLWVAARPAAKAVAEAARTAAEAASP